MQVIRGKVKKPFNVLLYGQPGAGKSTWAAAAPKPFFLAVDELDEMDIDRSAKQTTFAGVEKVLSEVLKEEHDYKTLVVDTIDAIEGIVREEILSKEKTDKTRSMGKAAGGFGKVPRRIRLRGQ